MHSIRSLIAPKSSCSTSTMSKTHSGMKELTTHAIMQPLCFAEKILKNLDGGDTARWWPLLLDTVFSFGCSMAAQNRHGFCWWTRHNYGVQK